MTNKNDFPMLFLRVNEYPLIYFDNAATTHKPQQMVDAMVQFYTKEYGTIHRGVYDAGERATTQYEQARAAVAKFINALDAREIIFTANSTASINLVAFTWARTHIKKGDEILLTELEHHSNVVPWQELARKTGAMLRFIETNEDGTLKLEQLDQLLSANTKLVAVSAVSNALGVHNDLQTIIKKAHKVGARVLVDATQLVPHARVDVHNLDCDFLVFSAHKMMGPTGIGVLYIKQELHEDTPPFMFGGGMVYEADLEHATYKVAPHKFEAGTPPIAQAIGLHAAIDYYNKHINFDALQKHEAALCAQLIDGLSVLQKVRILGPIDQLKQRGHLVSFVVDGMHPHDVSAYLNQYGICVRAGHHCAQPLAKKMGIDASVRVSFYAYNTADEVERFLEVMKQLVDSL